MSVFALAMHRILRYADRKLMGMYLSIRFCHSLTVFFFFFVAFLFCSVATGVSERVAKTSTFSASCFHPSHCCHESLRIQSSSSIYIYTYTYRYIYFFPFLISVCDVCVFCSPRRLRKTKKTPPATNETHLRCRHPHRETKTHKIPLKHFETSCASRHTRSILCALFNGL